MLVGPNRWSWLYRSSFCSPFVVEACGLVDRRIQSIEEAGTRLSTDPSLHDPKEPFELRVGIPGKFQIAALDWRTEIDST